MAQRMTSDKSVKNLEGLGKVSTAVHIIAVLCGIEIAGSMKRFENLQCNDSMC